MENKDSIAYTNDHLRKAQDIITHEFWELHERLRENYTTRTEQIKDIAELARLGTLLTKISEAREAVSKFVN
jgi:hypothetical protein